MDNSQGFEKERSDLGNPRKRKVSVLPDIEEKRKKKKRTLKDEEEEEEEAEEESKQREMRQREETRGRGEFAVALTAWVAFWFSTRKRMGGGSLGWVVCTY